MTAAWRSGVPFARGYQEVPHAERQSTLVQGLGLWVLGFRV